MKPLTFFAPVVLLPLISAGPASCSSGSSDNDNRDAAAGTTGGGTGGTGGATGGGSGGSSGGGSGGSGASGGSGGSSGGGSGGTGTADSGGGTGGSGADAATCQYGVQAPNPACNPCSQQNCCDELGACLTSAACRAMNTCVGTQPTPPCQTATTEQQLRTCLTMLCGADAASGVDAFIDTQLCLATNCEDECS
jgi:hypothetical protein